MPIEFNANFDVTQLSQKLDKQIEDALAVVMLSEIAVIKSRILSGVDTDGRRVASYAPYSKGYAQYKGSKGRPVADVNYSLTGSFIRSIAYKITKSGGNIRAVISPKGKNKILEGLSRTRPKHWGITEAQKLRILSKISSAISFK